ncbi:hypothetical protein SAMN05216223_1323 [Actinacidiphila yanglinensis]|uniref:HEAT repeat-containing protein n=1 Tax=Actinacidiphila yanglinensis TaxID=310779 RepID=A0A1H6EBD7_9ACTN|nr:hypothetical protein [Actinacidiphila yanglinensis]SEG95067.1 hypothetical protein SAMN05216223_1323 [Actinacidiphila yanglinensis]
MSRTPEPAQVPHPVSPSALDAFEAALTPAAMNTPESERNLVAALRGMDTAGESATALRFLSDQPRVVLRLDEAVRQTAEYRLGRTHRAGRAEVSQGAVPAEASPLGVALAACHPDGRVRERAVGRIHLLLGGPQPPLDLVPFLVLRTADWAGPVRDRARGALALLLHEHPEVMVPATAPLTLLVVRRERGGFARQQLVSALVSSPGTTLFEPLLASPDVRLRRFALRTALANRRLPLRTLVAITRRDGDRQCRGLAAEAAVRDAVWTEQTDLLRQLATSVHHEVRVVALVGLLRRGLAAEVTPSLGDTSPLVRSVARDAARRTGTDALGWYRAAVHEPAPGLIAGLAETGRKEDADLLAPLLGHQQAPIRAAALRGLRALDAVAVERAVPLLRDPSTKVIREATTTLRSCLDQLPPGTTESLLADRDRAAVRRAGYRLLDEPDALRRLRTNLRIATDPDPRLARWAAGAAAALIRELHPSPWHSRASGVRPAFDPTADERHELLVLAGAAAALLPHRPRQLLQEQLDPASPTTELLRVRYGPHPDTTNPLLDVEATFTAEDPHRTIALMREVLLAVLPYAVGPADAWPADERWPEILPTWFVERCAPEVPVRRGATADWLTRWRGQTPQQRMTDLQTDAVADWRLLDWINLFDPDGMADSRSWRWWDGGVRRLHTGWVRFGTDGHPYGGRLALHWLIEAAGGYAIELP